MKKNKLRFILPLLILLLFSYCKKPNNPAPVQDTELQTSIDASWANFVISDIEMICSFAAEDASNKKHFYYHVQGTPPLNQTMIIRDIATNRISINFNQTKCLDGRVRDGSIFIFFKEPQYLQHPATGNENYMRDYNFTGRVTLEEYKVDGWLVEDKDFSVFIKNLRPNSNTPIAGPLQWSFEGDFTMRKDLSTMSWKGKYVKTLTNTDNPSVFNPGAQLPIQWPKAIIAYKGSATGTTQDNTPFSYSIFDAHPLTRDFSCFPDAVSNVDLVGNSSNPVASPQFSESHPFTSGVVSFTTGTAYPRLIYYANEQNTFGGSGEPEINLPLQCDNKATVQIKGVYYSIDLRK